MSISEPNISEMTEDFSFVPWSNTEGGGFSALLQPAMIFFMISAIIVMFCCHSNPVQLFIFLHLFRGSHLVPDEEHNKT